MGCAHDCTADGPWAGLSLLRLAWLTCWSQRGSRGHRMHAQQRKRQGGTEGLQLSPIGDALGPCLPLLAHSDFSISIKISSLLYPPSCLPLLTPTKDWNWLSVLGLIPSPNNSLLSWSESTGIPSFLSLPQYESNQMHRLETPKTDA